MSAVERLQALAQEMKERRTVDRSIEVPESEPGHGMQHYMDQAHEALRDYDTASNNWRTFAHEVMKLESERPVLQEDIKVGIMESHPNMTLTQVDRLARIDPRYINYLKRQRDTMRIRDQHWAEVESALLRCHLAIAAIKGTGGLL